MKERPILFSAPMVRALLDGSKMQTRRAMKHQPHEDWLPAGYGELHGFNKDGDLTDKVIGWGAVNEDGDQGYACPYGRPGDRLVVASEIPDVHRTYCAGSDGVIYSRARGAYRPLKAHGNKNGYLCVTIMDGARKTTRAVHSLVCSAFYGPSPFDGAQVRHIDGNPDRCSPNNLAWGTQEQNWRDRRSHGNGMEGEKHHNAKLSDVERAHLRWAVSHGLTSQRNAARALGMSQGAIGKVMEGCEIDDVDPDVPENRIPSILLEIVSVRVERLQDISTEDIIAEGLRTTLREHDAECDLRDQWRALWESTGGDWESNPWLWVIEFSRVTP